MHFIFIITACFVTALSPASRLILEFCHEVFEGNFTILTSSSSYLLELSKVTRCQVEASRELSSLSLHFRVSRRMISRRQIRMARRQGNGRTKSSETRSKTGKNGT